MTENSSGGSPLRSNTEPGTPTGISSPLKQMKVSTKNTPPLGTRKKVYLMEGEEKVITGETNYCRRIPIYDEPFSGTVADTSGKTPDVSPSAARQVTAIEGCTQTSCDVSRRLQKKLGQSTSPKAAGREVSK